jgi:mannose-1-phosphate guanylyltransferase/phosphomannomutase
MILAAGRGERMLPLTSTLPKALLPVLGRPLLEIIAEKLLRSGVSEIHCNLFHLPGPIEAFAAGKRWPMHFHREPELLGTGGGIGNMADSVSAFEATLLHNGDILSDIDLCRVLSFHESRGPLVTLVLVPSGPRANVLRLGSGEVLAIGSDAEAPGAQASRLGYTGIAILSPQAFAYFPRGKRMGFVGILSDMIRIRPGSVMGYDAAAEGAPFAWSEAGSPEGYLDIHRRILIDKVRFDPILEPPPLPLHAGDGAVIDPGAEWSGFLEVGPRAAIRRGASLENCVVLEGAAVAEGERHSNEIIFQGGTMKAGRAERR